MDVYRKEIYVERNFLKYALFVSFFPQLVAGPIERSKNLLKQISTDNVFSYENFRRGLLIMLWGYFQKIVIADRIGILVDTVYGNVGKYAGGYYLLASVLFAVQIYCDFSGYSLIAAGAARVMGFQLMENFNCPYFAKSVAEFWRRLNGLFQVAGNIFAPVRKRAGKRLKLNENSFGSRVFCTLATFAMVDVTWIFFRAANIQDALHMIKSIFTVQNPWIFTDNSIYGLGLEQKQMFLLIFSLAVLFAADWLKYKKINMLEKILEQDLWCRWTVYLGGILFVLIFGIWGNAYDAQAFVYFQF